MCVGGEKTCVWVEKKTYAHTFFRPPFRNGWRHRKSNNIRLVRNKSYGARYFRLCIRLFLNLLSYGARLFSYDARLLTYDAPKYGMLYVRKYRMHRTNLSYARTK